MGEALQISEEIMEQLEEVRKCGRTNMISRLGVQRVANDLDLYELVVFCEDHRRQWGEVIRRFGEWKANSRS